MDADIRTNDHPPAFELDALHAREGSPATAAHAEQCQACRAYLAELDAEARRFAAAYDPVEFVRRARARADQSDPGTAAARSRRARWARSAALLAVGAVASFWLLASPGRWRAP